MAHFNLENYETVQQRIDAFWVKHPEGRILTEVVYRDEKTFVVRAEIYLSYDHDEPAATGHAEEIIGSSPVNKTSALENCETSAIGRALRIGGVGREASREEMEKVQRRAQTLALPELLEYMTPLTSVQEWRGAYSLAVQNGLVNEMMPDGLTTVGEYITQKGKAKA